MYTFLCNEWPTDFLAMRTFHSMDLSTNVGSLRSLTGGSCLDDSLSTFQFFLFSEQTCSRFDWASLGFGCLVIRLPFSEVASVLHHSMEGEEQSVLDLSCHRQNSLCFVITFDSKLASAWRFDFCTFKKMPTIYMILPSGNFHWAYVIQRMESALSELSLSLWLPSLSLFLRSELLLQGLVLVSISRFGNENP